MRTGIVQMIKGAMEIHDKGQQEGHPNESYAAGWLCERGCVLPYAPRQAAEFFERAVSQGHLAAHVALAACYLLGRGVDKNQPKAVELYRAADKANPRLSMH
jgi:TPR repeat protein